MRRVLCLSMFALSWHIWCQRAKAETIYGVDSAEVLAIETSTRTTTFLYDLSAWSPGGVDWVNGGNSLAFDAFTNNLIFTERGGTRVATYNLDSGTATVIADLDTFTSVTSQITAGTTAGRLASGAFFYDNAFYFTIEDINGSGAEFSRLFRADFNPSHTSFTSVGLVTFGGGDPYLGDFGDMAVEPDGTVFGSSSNGGSTGPMSGFWSFNVNDPAAGVTSINTSTPLAQLAFSADFSTLYASRSSIGDLATINTSTGAYNNLGQLSGISTSVTDMSQATSPAPEPAGAVLLVLGVLLVFRRRDGAVSAARPRR